MGSKILLEGNKTFYFCLMFKEINYIYLLIFLLFQYFVFDFHMPPIMLFDKIITLSVSETVFFFFQRINLFLPDISKKYDGALRANLNLCQYYLLVMFYTKLVNVLLHDILF